MIKEDIPYLNIPTIKIDILKEVRPDGSIYLKSAVDLAVHPKRITERLQYWTEHAPDRIFLAQRGLEDEWVSFTYGEVWTKIQNIGQFLLKSGASTEKPIAILSGNSLEHGLLALAAMHVGIPYAPISPAYSLKSSDYGKLRHCINLLTPGLLFVQEGKTYNSAIKAVAESVPVVAVKNVTANAIDFDELLKMEATKEVSAAFERLGPNTIAKILFTSGSTGMPKGVINTHGNMTANWQQITQTFPFMENGGLTLIDWLPWNHTFGGNHNFGLTFYNGGSLYIDEGDPTSEGFLTTLRNLRSIAPTIYFNVPKGFEELVRHLKEDDELCQMFFSRLKMLFYAGASMSQKVWDELEALAHKTIGKRIFIGSGLGMTEACPSALFNTRYGQHSGRLGVPVPGLEAKLVPKGDTFEVRFRGSNITPGYWRDAAQTTAAFDEEGFYKTGDALKFVDDNDPNVGMVFDGRLAENFKLSSGTWVNVGVLKARLVTAANGLIKDVVVTGHDKEFIGAILFPDISNCARLAGLSQNENAKTIMRSKVVVQALQKVLARMGEESTGSSTIIKRALLADFTPSIEKGEITDKGSINQRAILSNRKSILQKMYNKEVLPGVIQLNT